MQFHITLLYAGLAGLLLVILSFNVMQNWVRVTGVGQSTDRDMRRAERVLSSFVEYVPLGLILLALIEFEGAQSFIVHGLGASLMIGRVLHAYGSNDMPGSGLLRFIGSQLTYLVLAIASLACLYYFVLGQT
jgi:uncharacterized membrane protein YecN with MAPEG domain